MSDFEYTIESNALKQKHSEKNTCDFFYISSLVDVTVTNNKHFKGEIKEIYYLQEHIFITLQLLNNKHITIYEEDIKSIKKFKSKIIPRDYVWSIDNNYIKQVSKNKTEMFFSANEIVWIETLNTIHRGLIKEFSLSTKDGFTITLLLASNQTIKIYEKDMIVINPTHSNNRDYFYEKVVIL